MAPGTTLPPFDLSSGRRARTRLNNGASMPVLGLGVWKVEAGAPTREAVHSALAAGYRLVDTAAMYGNEAAVGEAVRALGVPRDELFVTTKLWNDDQGYDSALAAFARSQRNLDLGPVDLYLVHWPVPKRRLESWKALEHLLARGDVRSIGVSNFAVRHLKELLEHASVVPAVNQVEFSPFLYQRELLDFCRDHGIQLEAYAPLTRGRRLNDATLGRIGARHGRTEAQVAIRWGLQHNVVEIPKSVHPARIEENLASLDFALDASEMTALDALNEDFRTSWDPHEMA